MLASRAMCVHVAAALLVTATGCASKASSSAFGSDAGHHTAGDAGIAPDPTGDAGELLGSDAAPSPGASCSQASRLVYVVSREGDLYSFDPSSVSFTRIGRLNCSASATPVSMAIDRDAVAWVLYSDGNVFKVSTGDASCQSSPYTADQISFHTFGMGYATNDGDPSSDTLYIDDHEGKGIGKVDKSGHATFLGQVGAPLSGNHCELTGTGDGRLFGFFTTSPAQVAEIDKNSGAILSNQPLAGVSTGTEWAFSFWGGDFYLYTAHADTGPPLQQTSTTVTRYRPSDKSVTVLRENIGFRVVGAGVSTCAPTTPVR